MTFSEIVRYARMRLSLSQEALAKELGISAPSVTNIGDKPNVTDVTKTDMEEAIIEQIKLNPKVTVDQLAEKLQVNRRTILRCITLMKQKGTIKRHRF